MAMGCMHVVGRCLQRRGLHSDGGAIPRNEHAKRRSASTSLFLSPHHHYILYTENRLRFDTIMAISLVCCFSRSPSRYDSWQFQLKALSGHFSSLTAPLPLTRFLARSAPISAPLTFSVLALLQRSLYHGVLDYSVFSYLFYFIML